jgi:hypothetical protein
MGLTGYADDCAKAPEILQAARVKKTARLAAKIMPKAFTL